MVSAPARRAAAALLGAMGAAALPGACGGDSTELEWRVVFADEADREQARRLEASIRRDGCDGEALYETSLDRGAMVSMEPPDLEPGEYSFVARAFDAQCRVIAEGCVTEELPLDDGMLEQRLDPADGRDACDGVCTDGACTPCTGTDCPPTDGGMDGGDAGMDAGPPLDPPVVLSPWNGWSTGSALADESADTALSDPPRRPEVRWEGVDRAETYRVEWVRCDERLAADCDFSSPTATRTVADGEPLRARPTSPLEVETETPPLGARYAFRVGACAGAGGSDCSFAAARSIEVGRLHQDVHGDGLGDLFLVGRLSDGTRELRRVEDSSAPTTVWSADDIRAAGWTGDYDGDGIGELAVGTTGAPGGRLVFLDEEVETGAVSEDTSGADFAASIVGLDDVDGDGYADFAASAVGEDEVRVFLGGPSFDASRAITVPAPDGVGDFGLAIGRAGDRDSDGLADLLVAGLSGTVTAEVQVYSLADRTPVRLSSEPVSLGPSPPADPISIAGGLDMDGDGVPEVVAGSPGFNALSVFFREGADSHSRSGDFGADVVLGDLDGTGRARALVGAPTFEDATWGRDGTSFHVTRESGSFFTVRIRFIRTEGEARFGHEVTAVDVDGDGRDDATVMDGQGDVVHVVFYDPDTMSIDAIGRVVSRPAEVEAWEHLVR